MAWGGPTPLRPSLRERARVAERLRAARSEERLSLDTFAARLDLAYTTRSDAELGALVADLPDPHPLSRLAFRAAAAASAWTASWGDRRRRRCPTRLLLPEREPVLFGRARDCDCVVLEETVSRRHARLDHRDGRWYLSDLGSANGTYVNGARVVEEVEVRAGDELWFGDARFVLTAARRPVPQL